MTQLRQVAKSPAHDADARKHTQSNYRLARAHAETHVKFAVGGICQTVGGMGNWNEYISTSAWSIPFKFRLSIPVRGCFLYLSLLLSIFKFFLPWIDHSLHQSIASHMDETIVGAPMERRWSRPKFSPVVLASSLDDYSGGSAIECSRSR